MSLIPVRRALVSVSDKTGLIEFAKTLESFGVEIISTGGTLKALKDAGIKAISISDVTQFPEILDGRVKTLHPKIHGGLLFLRDNKEHAETAKKQGIEPIDMVVVNLYPFEKTVAKSGVALEEAIENIDIGGPSMLRSGAKNFRSVVVISDPADYAAVSNEMKQNSGKVSSALSAELAVKVFEKTNVYDGAIAQFLGSRLRKATESTELPRDISVKITQEASLRYGENPHQRAALYSSSEGARVKFEQLHGKELSFNNLLDLEAASDILDEFAEPAACIIKHNNPCGIGVAGVLWEALDKAIDSDPISAFGGIIGLNRTCDQKTVEALFKKLQFIEVVIAPDFEPKAVEILSQKKNLRILKMRVLTQAVQSALDIRFTRFGALVQDEDPAIRLTVEEAMKTWKVATKKGLEKQDFVELLFAWKCAKLVKSNAIVLTKNLGTVGIGAGQMSRVDSVRISCEKAGAKTQGSCLGSDAFFPMPDSIEIAARHGIRAIVQPGGSIKDEDVIKAADQHGIPMVFTGTRHFRH